MLLHHIESIQGFFCFLSFFLVAQWEKYYYCKKKKNQFVSVRLRSSLLILFVCSCSCSCSVVNYSCWLYFCHFVSFVSFVTSFVSFVSLYSILFCYPFLLLLLLFSLSLLCGMLQPPVAIFFNLLENVGEGRVKRKRKIRWRWKKKIHH